MIFDFTVFIYGLHARPIFQASRLEISEKGMDQSTLG
jgi:hypothetical protein